MAIIRICLFASSGFSKNSKSICYKAFFKITKGWFWDCCSCNGYGWTNKGDSRFILFFILHMENNIHITHLPETNLYLSDYLTDIRKGWEGDLLYCEHSWILSYNGELVSETWIFLLVVVVVVFNLDMRVFQNDFW